MRCEFCGNEMTEYDRPLHGECAAMFKEQVKFLKHKPLYLYLSYLHPEATQNIELAQNLVWLSEGELGLGYSFGFFGNTYPESPSLTNDFDEMIEDLSDYTKLYQLNINLSDKAKASLDRFKRIFGPTFTLSDVRKVVRKVLIMSENSADVESEVDHLISLESCKISEKKLLPTFSKGLKEKELPTCKTCIYSVLPGPKEEKIECWKYVPKDQVINGAVLTFAPNVRRHTCCGEGKWFIEGQQQFFDYFELIQKLCF